MLNLAKKCCKTCGIIKPLSDFGLDKRNGRHRLHCKPCLNNYAREYHKNNIDKIREQKRLSLQRRRQNNPAVKEKDKQWVKNNPEKVREIKRRFWLRHEHRLKPIQRRNNFVRYLKKLGITEDSIKVSFDRQGGLCGICLKPINLDSLQSVSWAERAVLDHCHRSGKFRGVLCPKCNTFLGMADDDPDRLIRAAEYLRNN